MNRRTESTISADRADQAFRVDSADRAHLLGSARTAERVSPARRAVANEFAKMRGRGVAVIAASLVLGVLALSLVALLSGADVDPASPQAWHGLLAGMSLGVPLLSPLLLAVLASRQTEIEHEGQGWLLQATSGLTPGAVCRAKLVALGVVVTAATLAASSLVAAVGAALGFTAPLPLAQWAGFTACLVVVNLVVLALHVLLSARVENQLVALGVGALGVVVAVFSQGLPAAAAHVTPWGYYALARAAGYEGEHLRALPIAYPSVAALALVAAGCVAVVTARLDRQEV